MIGPQDQETMLAQRLPSILPNMTLEESLQVTNLQHRRSIAKGNALNYPKTLSVATPYHLKYILVGGRIPKPGKYHYLIWVLFLDELPEFQRNALEVLRQPLEDKQVTISRVNATLRYPAILCL